MECIVVLSKSSRMVSNTHKFRMFENLNIFEKKRFFGYSIRTQSKNAIFGEFVFEFSKRTESHSNACLNRPFKHNFGGIHTSTLLFAISFVDLSFNKYCFRSTIILSSSLLFIVSLLGGMCTSEVVFLFVTMENIDTCFPTCESAEVVRF